MSVCSSWIAIQPLRDVASHPHSYAATILAYGQTGSGKTHTMAGYGDVGGSGARLQAAVRVVGETPTTPTTSDTVVRFCVLLFPDPDSVCRVDTGKCGVVPRAAHYIFNKIEQLGSVGARTTVVATYCEVYNEKVQVVKLRPMAFGGRVTVSVAVASSRHSHSLPLHVLLPCRFMTCWT